jgi:hypothetical protein
MFSSTTCVGFELLKAVVLCPSEASVDFQRTARRYIPEDGTLQNYLRLCTRPQELSSDHFTVTHLVIPPLLCYQLLLMKDLPLLWQV